MHSVRVCEGTFLPSELNKCVLKLYFWTRLVFRFLCVPLGARNCVIQLINACSVKVGVCYIAMTVLFENIGEKLIGIWSFCMICAYNNVQSLCPYK